MVIPGTTTDEQLSLVTALSSEVDEYGWIVEVGAFHGRQSVAICESKHDSVMLSCIDPFPELPVFEHGYLYTKMDWIDNTKSYNNVNMVRGLSPLNIAFISFQQPPDLVILDIDDVLDSIDFWNTHLKVGGKIVVHTYNDCGTFSDISSQVFAYAQSQNFIVDNKNYSVILTKSK